MSRMMTLSPDDAQTCAIPVPIRPEPMMPTVSTAMGDSCWKMIGEFATTGRMPRIVKVLLKRNEFRLNRVASRVLRHCERSEAIQCHEQELDCFGAEPVIGPRSARTRWRLAMTEYLVSAPT